ncbi:MAG: GatB/YqeY domain-containing protein, partial [Patescibacteria group bacterium]
TPENFAELLTLLAGGKLTQANGLKVLTAMLESGADPTHIMEDMRLGRMEDTAAVADVVDRVLANFPSEVDRYRAGEMQLLKFFIGMVMKESEGSVDAGTAKNILVTKLG